MPTNDANGCFCRVLSEKSSNVLNFVEPHMSGHGTRRVHLYSDVFLRTNELIKIGQCFFPSIVTVKQHLTLAIVVVFQDNNNVSNTNKKLLLQRRALMCQCRKIRQQNDKVLFDVNVTLQEKRKGSKYL